MATEFFDYVKRDNELAPDWSAVSSKISDDLTTISQERQAKRTEIEQSTQQAVDALNQQEMGANQTLNQMIMDGSRSSTAYLLAQDKLMKANKIKPEQYMISKQAQLDDWSTLSGAVKGWNKDYDEYKTRMESDTSAGMERSMAEWNEEFGNVSNKSIVVNPTNGRLYMATRNEDGSINTDPDKMVTVNALNNRLKDRVEKYDINAKVNTQVEQLGAIYNIVNKNGIMAVDDVRQNAAFEAAKSKMITSLMGTDRNTSSILSDNVGGYGFTQDKKMQGKKDESGNEMILLVADKNGLYQPEFTKAQKDAAESYVEAQLEMQLGHKETAAAPKAQRRSSSTAGERSKRKIESVLFQTAVDVAKGDQAAIERVIRDTEVSNMFLDPSTKVWTIQFDDPATADVTYQSTGDSETDAERFLEYTVGEGYTNKYGAASAVVIHDSWRGVGGAAADTEVGARQSLENMVVSEITYGEDQDDLFGAVDDIISDKKASVTEIMSRMKNVLQKANLPGGINPRDLDIKPAGNGKIRISYNGVDYDGYHPRNAMQGFQDTFQKIIDSAVDQYNAAPKKSMGDF